MYKNRRFKTTCNNLGLSWVYRPGFQDSPKPLGALIWAKDSQSKENTFSWVKLRIN